MNASLSGIANAQSSPRSSPVDGVEAVESPMGSTQTLGGPSSLRETKLRVP